MAPSVLSPRAPTLFSRNLLLDPPLLPIGSGVVKGIANAFSNPPPDSSTLPPDSSTLPPDSSTPPPDSFTPPPDSSTPPPDSFTPPPDSSDPTSSSSNSFPIPSDLPALTIPLHGNSTLTVDAPPVVTTLLSDATSAVAPVLSDASSGISAVTAASELPEVSSFISQATQTLGSGLSGGVSSLGSIVSDVIPNIFGSSTPVSTITPFHIASDPLRPLPFSLLSTDGSPTSLTKLPTSDPHLSMGTFSSVNLITVSISSSDPSLTVSAFSLSVGPLSSTPSTPIVSPDPSWWPMDSSSITAPPSSVSILTIVPTIPPPASPSEILVATNSSSNSDSRSTINVLSVPTTLPSSTPRVQSLNSVSASLSESSSSSQSEITGSQGSGSSSTGIPSATQGSANSVPKLGFFNHPATVAGTFTAVGVVVVAAAVGVIILTRLRGRHRRGSHRIPNSDPDEERMRDIGPTRQRSLQTNTHRSFVSHQSTLPSVEVMQAETPFVNKRNTVINNYQVLRTSETLVGRSSWSMVPNSRVPTSPVDPVDPHGWPIIASELESNTQQPAVSPDPYSADPDTRAAMGWILADEATLESLPEYEDSNSLLNVGYGTRPIQQ